MEQSRVVCSSWSSQATTTTQQQQQLPSVKSSRGKFTVIILRFPCGRNFTVTVTVTVTVAVTGLSSSPFGHVDHIRALWL
mmetsp:Transcript_10456/g.11854  ORF Transcript_10456/g.11854 Transcript_10456/m.11854 type:complete len:80 (-) Transcript_10456:364-603(-)